MKKFEERNLKVKCYSQKLWLQVLFSYIYYKSLIINQTFNDKIFFVASMEDENHTGKNISSLLENKKHTKERRKYEEMNNDRKSRSVDRKYSER